MRIKLSVLLASATLSLFALSSGAEARSHHHHVKHHLVKHHHARHHMKHRRHAMNGQVSQATRDHVVALIKSQAPQYGVPTWFALKIARVESNYNPRVTGAAGEIGVFQLKCATAHGVGYSGSCSGLYNPETNVRVGLKHLSLAVHAARGNLRLAASKHNGGLGCNHIVRSYVAMIF